MEQQLRPVVEQEITISLSNSVSHVVERYFDELAGEPFDLYRLVIEEVEPSLFETVMRRARYNQSKAAVILGLSRGTFRSKLRKYFDDKYVGTRDDH